MKFEPDPIGHASSFRSEEIQFLHLLAKRAFQSVHMNPVLTNLNTARRQDRPSHLRVGSLTFHLPNPENHRVSPGNVECLGCRKARYQQVRFSGSGDMIATCLEGFLEFCSDANESPHIIVLNELSISYQSKDIILRKLKTIAQEHQIYIVAGSYHDTQTYYNIAPIIGPDGRSEEIYKHLSAHVQGERIRTPDAKEINIVSSDYGNFIVWICFDMYDPALILKFLNASNRFTWGDPENGKRRKDLDFVLVPSFNSDSPESIIKNLKLISKFSKVALFCSNSFGQRMESFAFLGGHSIDSALSWACDDDPGRGKLCQAELFCLERSRLDEVQAADFLEDGTFSAQFSAVIKGDYAVRNIPK